MDLRKRLEKYKDKYPETVKYICKTFKKNLRCGACGGPILREINMKGYPYQCMNCDEDKYDFEVKRVIRDITDKELDDLVERTAELLLLDNQTKENEEMSTCYWTIQGIGICTNDIIDHIDKKKLAHMLMEQLPDDEELLSIIKSKNYDNLNVDDFLYGEPFDNLAELLCHCDDTDSITYDDNGQGADYFYYPPSMPWNRRVNEPQSREEVYERIIAAVQKITTLSCKDIDELITDLHEEGWG